MLLMFGCNVVGGYYLVEIMDDGVVAVKINENNLCKRSNSQCTVAVGYYFENGENLPN
jgi:predicted Zn-dependent protease